MPQASNEMRALMSQYFGGGGIDDHHPTQYLFAHGYIQENGYWSKPTPSHTVSDYEWDCLNFLCNEWDYAYNFKDLSNFTNIL